MCLFTYGLSGSGKTYTMQGGTGRTRGILPRAIDHALKHIQNLEQTQWICQIHVSFLEIYKNKIFDLLSKYDQKEKDVKSFNNVTTIRLTPANETVTKLIKGVASRRMTGSTTMNVESSRSHLVCVLNLVMSYSTDAKVLKSTLTLVDLAGVEPSNVSGDVNERSHINTSLKALRACLLAKAKKTTCPPSSRDTKLTSMLMPLITGGNGSTLMILNVSPTESDAVKTLHSLNFGTGCRSERSKCKALN